MKKPTAPHLQPLTEGPNIPLDKPVILIGRHQECDIQIPSRKISRRHCCLAQVGTYLVVRDLGSTNGVRINGVKVLEGSLSSGDELTIGNIRYKLNWGEKLDPSAASALKNGILLQKPKVEYHNSSEDSCEQPVALPDMSLSQPVPQGMPFAPAMQKRAAENGQSNENGDVPARGSARLISEDVILVPLDPP